MPEYRTPGVYIEEISTGPRPVAASPTTETGFVGILQLPPSFLAGRGKAAGMFVPGPEEQPLLTWNRGVAFRGLLEAVAPPKPTEVKAEEGADKEKKVKPAASAANRAGGNRFKEIISEILPGRWDVQTPGKDDVVCLEGDGVTLRIPVRRTLMSVKTSEQGQREWDLAVGADEMQVVQLVAAKALEQRVTHSGNLGSVDTSASAVTPNIAAIHDAMMATAPAVHSVDGFEQWRVEFGRDLFIQLVSESKGVSPARAQSVWEGLAPDAREAWARWIRSNPGMRRLEIAVRGFFENGGQTAFIGMGVQVGGAGGPGKRQMLEKAFDGVSTMAMLCAPGLDADWQRSILEYAGPRGRGDLFAIVETPRHLLTREARDLKVNEHRWTVGGAPYEMMELQTVASPQQSELRFQGFAADEVLDRCVPRDESGYGAAYGPWLVVENPLSTGAHDRYVIAPPSGHVAGVIASTDLKPGGGVHKAPANEQMVGVSELVTSISDREQAALNTKGINIIRHRPGAGIRIWGARTVASDPLWTYINVRRLFLFVERSVRDAIQWAVFLPNTQQTRSDLRSTINSFLYRLYMQQMLDGATWQEAFSVRCDAENNPDPDVRSGLLTVDVELRPVYPAEFIRVRFRQSPMRSDVIEG